MTPILFVTNGHGEASIAKRIAADVRGLGPYATDHLALVGQGFGDAAFIDVGPQATMPSGGLVAMGNVRAFASDVRAGFMRVFAAQIAFLRAARVRYRCVVAVGDVYALIMSRFAGLPTIFVGTAKSVHVAPYGAFERRVLRGARAVFVRDAPTAAFLRERGVTADAPGNVIADLLSTENRVSWPAGASERLVLLPGSRDRAYHDALLLATVARRVAARVPGSAAILSIAPGLDAARFGPALAGEPSIGGWSGDLGALLADATFALGQAGTANEAAVACGVPVAAFEFDGARKSAWYRMRQARLLGDALVVLPGDPDRAADAIAAILADPDRRARMSRVGRERMGRRGGAAVIARAIAALAVPAGA